MSEVLEKKIAELETENAALVQESYRLQIMLAHVLRTGGPVKVGKEALDGPLDEDGGIVIDELETEFQFRYTTKSEEEQSNA